MAAAPPYAPCMATPSADPARILVVEDEPTINQAVADRLRAEGFVVDQAHDGPGAVAAFEQAHPDLVVLDLMLPGYDGLEVCRRVQAIRPVPILMLTARSEETDLLVGLGVGADDYVTKPFSPRELVSRVKAILRRVEGAPAERIRIGDLEIDTASLQVKLSGQPIHLTTSEYGILLHLASHPGKAFSRRAILSALWGETPVGDERAVDVHIHNIREKLEADQENPEYLLTVRGFGYRLREP